MTPELEAKLDNLPAAPGVYLFKGRGDTVLYVGKARSSRAACAATSRPAASDTRFFITRLARELCDIETVVVGSEKEAALLENTLIKQHQPRYNVKLRDDKEYLSLRLDPQGRLAAPRGRAAARAATARSTSAPITRRRSARQTLRVVNRHFQLRTCTDTIRQSRVGRACSTRSSAASGPACSRSIARATASKCRTWRCSSTVATTSSPTARGAHERGGRASLDYERAAEHRDQLRAIERVREQNRVAVGTEQRPGRDGCLRQGDQAEVAVLQMRAGKLDLVRTFGSRT